MEKERARSAESSGLRVLVLLQPGHLDRFKDAFVGFLGVVLELGQPDDPLVQVGEADGQRVYVRMRLVELNGDVFLSYRRPIWDDKVDWKVQFNFRNAFGDNDPMPVVINPDGNIAVIRNAQQKTIFLTNTFSF